MKIYSAAQIKAWDAYTIENTPISSIDLMNRAVQVMSNWFVQHYQKHQPVYLFCGTGNNGGDGVALAQQLTWLDFDAKVVVCDLAGKRSADFDTQIAGIQQQGSISLEWHSSAASLPPVPSNALVVDALFGTGLNRPLSGPWLQVIDYLNKLPNTVIAIDLPSGLLADVPTPGEAVVKADKTFSFERPKLAFFFPENAERVGEWSFDSIGLLPDFEHKQTTQYYFLGKNEAARLYQPRSKFAHKGTYGHALLLAGSFGKMGAAVLAAKACLRAGAGLLSVQVPRSGNIVLQTAVPEAMAIPDHRAKHLSEIIDLQAYTSIGVGPGIGKDPETVLALKGVLQACKRPMVLDADALNILAENPEMWVFVPKNSILTPHPKEFERLFGKTTDDFQRNAVQWQMAQSHGVFILLKGAHSAIACPDGTCWFNSTGNPGMATGGSGDVLTGILVGLLAQNYPPASAVLLGVYLHGLAGDLAAKEISEESLIASDLVDYLGDAWLEVKGG